MKQKLRQLRVNTLVFLKEIFEKWLIQIRQNIGAANSEQPFRALSPIDNYENHQTYTDALNWALSNRANKNIKNVAISGPYGSGKSSIINTFIKHAPSQYQFLRISLASFKDPPLDSQEWLRLIEISILQQIFYCEKDQAIPDSRLSKIRSYEKGELTLKALLSLVVVFSLGVIISPAVIEKTFRTQFTLEDLSWLHPLSLFTATIGFVAFFRWGYRRLFKLKLSKLNVQPAEFEIDDTEAKSILNHYLDEILYFFSVSDKNVVVLEDMDRFKLNKEIYTKLRELNYLLNNSSRTKHKHIVFIYAVKDDLFTEEERTKFFDFIIPVIPFVNPSNSKDIFLKNQNGVDLFSEELLSDISLFVDNMRLLNNVMNEYEIYTRLIGDDLIPDQLLAMVLYKNIQPKDFADLANNEGSLYKRISAKKIIVQKQIIELNKEIDVVKSRIKEFEQLTIKNLTEVRSVYVLKMIEQLDGFRSFQNDQVKITVRQLLSDEYWPLFENQDITYATHFGNRRFPITFGQLEELVNAEVSYNERIDKNYVEELKADILRLENEKENVGNLTLKTLLQKYDNEVTNEALTKEEILVTILLRNGYINENYYDYISLFHEGSLSKNDHSFLLNTKSNNALSPDFELNQVEALISMMDQGQFRSSVSFNYSLVMPLLLNYKHVEKKNLFFKKLSDESDESIKFIRGFLIRGRENGSFMEELCMHFPRIWDSLSSNPTIEDDFRQIIFQNILSYADTNSIKQISKYPGFIEKILQSPDFLTTITDQKKLISTIETIDLKLKIINIHSSPPLLVDYIYESNRYEINPQTVEQLLAFKERLEPSRFANQNYDAIINSQLPEMIEYVDENLNTYLKQLYFKLSTNVEEPNETLILLLNNETVEINNKKQLISQVKNSIDELSNIRSTEVCKLLMQAQKLTPTWENLLNYYFNQGHDIDYLAVALQEIIAFINSGDIAESLGKKSLPYNVENEEERKIFALELLESPFLEAGAFNFILHRIPWVYDDFDLTQLDEEKVKLLFTKRGITFRSSFFDTIKSKFPPLHISYLETNKEAFLANVPVVALDDDDFLAILKSQEFSSKEKQHLLEIFDDSMDRDFSNIIETIAHLNVRSDDFIISEPIAKLLVASESISILEKLQVISKNPNFFDVEEIRTFLDSAGEPYSEIGDGSHRPTIPISTGIINFLDLLRDKGIISSFREDSNGIRVNNFLR